MVAFLFVRGMEDRLDVAAATHRSDALRNRREKGVCMEMSGSGEIVVYVDLVINLY